MPHLPPGSIDGGSVTVWLPCTQKTNGTKSALFTAEPTGQRTEQVAEDDSNVDVQLNSYRLEGYHIYRIDVQEENGTETTIVPETNRCRVNFYFATDEDMDKAKIPRKGKERREKILALDKKKWALKPPPHK